MLNRVSQIVHVDFSCEWRGGQQQLWLLAHELRQRGCEQTLVAPEGAVAQRFAGAGFRVLAPGTRAARQHAQTAAIVHAHEGHAHSWMLRAAHGGAARQVLSRRVAFAIRSPFSRWKYRRLDRVLAVSRFVAAQVQATGLAPARIAVVPDGIALHDLPDPAVARPRVRARSGIEADARWLVCLGALTPEKGVADAIAALARMPADCRLVLPGRGPLQPQLHRQAAALACAARVHFVTDSAFTPAEWVAAGDVVLMPSHEEGFGSAALLAMALERPVVASQAGGIPEVIEDGVTGLLVPVGATAALAEAGLRLLREPALASRLVAAAQARLRERFTVERMAEATLAAYDG
ncbi:MAG: glycosyltransferase family 1 protein [Acidobacteria bacterium]|nr:MAG: glycosyltransferase family 1 protein [Acidobacteriota bacterium]